MPAGVGDRSLAVLPAVAPLSTVDVVDADRSDPPATRPGRTREPVSTVVFAETATAGLGTSHRDPGSGKPVTSRSPGHYRLG